MAPRLCVSVPVHEELAVVFDQLENFRAFLPADALIVLHFAQGFSDPAKVQEMMPDGVLVNPVSRPTAWGNVIDTHHANFRFVNEREQFDYFMLHSSNDLFIRPGVERYIETADMGISQLPRVPWMQDPPGHVERHGFQKYEADLQRMTQELGAEQQLHTQAEGLFFRRELFADIIDIVDRYWEPNPYAMFAPEHLLYPTIASTLSKNIVPPYVYAEYYKPAHRHVVTPELIRAIRAGRYDEGDIVEFSDTATDGMEPDARLYRAGQIYGVKRVPRELHHPLRMYIRGLTRDHAGALRLRDPEPLPRFRVLTFIDEVIAHPSFLRDFGQVFDVSDDVGLLVYVPSTAEAALPLLERSVVAAGLDRADAPNIVALVRPPSEEVELYLTRIANVVCSNNPPEGVFYDSLHVPLEFARRLRRLSELATAPLR